MEFPAITSQAELEATQQQLGELLENDPNSPDGFLLTAQLSFFFLGEGNLLVSGTDGDDSLTGTDANENIAGMDGNDFISAGGGNDVLYGGTGNDDLFGGAGNDIFLASEGSDRFFGEAGDDSILVAGPNVESQLVFGGDGNDTIGTSDNDDEIEGGAGNDFITSDDGFDVISAGEGNDTVISGGDSPDRQILIENDNDIISGQGGDDLLFGEYGDDDISGGAGNDTLDGNGVTSIEGSVTITGIEPIEDGGVDFLSGDAGADTFVFGVEAGAYYASQGFDDVGIVIDFNPTEDNIQLSGSAEDYVLEFTYEGTSIFLDSDNNGVLSDTDDEIAVVEGVSNLDLNSSDFTFV